MPTRCQCLKADGQQCTRDSSQKSGHNPIFCYQHQNCKKPITDDLANKPKPTITIKAPTHVSAPSSVSSTIATSSSNSVTFTQTSPTMIVGDLSLGNDFKAHSIQLDNVTKGKWVIDESHGILRVWLEGEVIPTGFYGSDPLNIWHSDLYYKMGVGIFDIESIKSLSDEEKQLLASDAEASSKQDFERANKLSEDARDKMKQLLMSKTSKAKTPSALKALATRQRKQIDKAGALAYEAAKPINGKRFDFGIYAINITSSGKASILARKNSNGQIIYVQVDMDPYSRIR